MKKWMYVVFPGIMLIAFLVVYKTHVKEADAREAARTAKVEQTRLEEEAKKKDSEARARADAEKRQQERDADEKKKEDDRRKKTEAIDKQIRDETAQYKSDADKSAKEAAQLEIELDRLHKLKDSLSQQTFDLMKQVEAAKVAKQNAEMQQQRYTAMIAQRADQSALTALPPPPAK